MREFVFFVSVLTNMHFGAGLIKRKLMLTQTDGV